MKPLLEKYLPLSANSRQKDHYSHFILRLAFASTEDLRRRFSRVETSLFRLRFQNDDVRERQAFVESLNFDWEMVGEQEKRELGPELVAAGGGFVKRMDEESWFKVDWERVPELVETRRVLLKAGKAYVPGREQLSMVVAEFTTRLDKALEVGMLRLHVLMNTVNKSLSSPPAPFLASMRMTD
jgi:DNA primase large subunit